MVHPCFSPMIYEGIEEIVNEVTKIFLLGGVVEATLGVQIAEMPLGFQIRVGNPNQLYGGHPWLE